MDPAEAVYAVVKRVPPGRVVTYGQVAGLVEGVTLTPREVGAIMNVAPPEVPWQRVVGAKGTLPIGKRGTELMLRQRSLLEQEGVAFLPSGQVDMAAHQWSPEGGDALGGLFE